MGDELELKDIIRTASRLLENSKHNHYTDLFAAPNAKIGMSLRIRLPYDYKVVEAEPVEQFSLFPTPQTDMYQVQQDIREKAGITKSPECHDEVSLDEWRRRVGKTFDSYRIY